MKRKFSFDIPRLRIGPSKADTNALRDHLAIQVDSPPVTPKSVRPPLSPIVEADLRAACTYILQNFKPSHVVYEEQYGGSQQKQKQQLDYAAIKESVHGQVEDAASRPLSNVSSRTREPTPAAVEISESEAMSPDRLRHRPEAATETISNNAHEDKANKRKSALLRAEQLMLTGPPKAPPPTTRQRSESHLRSVSAPFQPALAAPKIDLVERPRIAQRSASTGTTGSTPQTDATDYPWSDEKASTAMTSAAITPARSSKRTSSQALQSGSEASSMPKVEPVDADWMRTELGKHKKAQQERLQQEKAREEREETAVCTETTPKQVTQAPTPIVIRRKPVPTSRSASKARQPVRADSGQSNRPSGEVLRSPSLQAEEAPRTSSKQDVDSPRSYSRQDVNSPRSDSRQDSHPPRSASRQESRPPRSESRQARALQRAPSRARSISRQVREYIRPNSAQRTVRPDEVSRPGSRAGSVTRQVKEYFRPATAASSRKPSMDGIRPDGRSRSIDSFHSAANSDKAPSTASSTSKWRTFKPFHRRDASRDAAENSRPGTAGSMTDSRGRATSRDAKHSPQQQKAKPVINLNRELPPLPSLTQWKSADAEKVKPSTVPVSPVKDKTGYKTPKSHRSSQRSKTESKLVIIGPELGERDEILDARMGSPTPLRSHKSSLDLRSAPPRPSAPPPAVPTMVSANITGPNDFAYESYHQLGPTVTIEPSTAIADMKKERRRSKSIQAAFPSELHDKVKNAMGDQSTAEKPKPTSTGNAPLINYSRVAGGPLKGGLSRSVTKAGHTAATTSHTPVGHSRNNSNAFARKFSMDDYTRMHDSRYQNLVEISAPVKQAPAMPVRDKKWWQKMGKKPSSPSWMDQVVKSGSRSGVLLTDQVAGAPIVRY